MEDSVQISSRFEIPGEWMVFEAQSHHSYHTTSPGMTQFSGIAAFFFFSFELGIVIFIKVNLSLISTKICRIFSYEAFS